MFHAAELCGQNERLFLTESRRSPAAAGLPCHEAGSGSTRGLELSPCSVFLHECGRYPYMKTLVSTKRAAPLVMELSVSRLLHLRRQRRSRSPSRPSGCCSHAPTAPDRRAPGPGPSRRASRWRPAACAWLGLDAVPLDCRHFRASWTGASGSRASPRPPCRRAAWRRGRWRGCAR